jgi:hypothetical protein
MRQDVSRVPLGNSLAVLETPGKKQSNQISLIDLIHLINEQTDMKTITSKNALFFSFVY